MGAKGKLQIKGLPTNKKIKGGGGKKTKPKKRAVGMKRKCSAPVECILGWVSKNQGRRKKRNSANAKHTEP